MCLKNLEKKEKNAYKCEMWKKRLKRDKNDLS